MRPTPDDIVNFWFYEIGHDKWFVEDFSFDSMMKERFEAVYEMAATGKLEEWKHTPEGTLALLLLLDEFPRRMFRGTSRAFETDDEALQVAREGIIKHFDDRIDRQFKMLFYLPFLNSEDLNDQRLAIYYIRERAKEAHWLTIAEQNFDIVKRFGRFPQRNPILGRETTPEEVEFLKNAHILSAAAAELPASKL